MNIAFPALVFLVLILPGLLFYFAYIGRLRRSSDAVIHFGQFSMALIMAIVVSAIFHAIWVFLARTCFVPVDIKVVLALLGAPESAGLSSAQVAQGTTAFPINVFGYFLSIYIAAFACGIGFRKAVREFQLDLRFDALRYSNEWHYIFSGETVDLRDGPRVRRADAVLLTVASDCAAGTYLYVGFLEKYELDGAGDLRWIMLGSPVYRRRLDDDRELAIDADDDTSALIPSNGPAIDHRYYPIAGDRFVVWARDILSLNVDYLFTAPTDSLVGVEAGTA